jgi:hypothetical protein
MPFQQLRAPQRHTRSRGRQQRRATKPAQLQVETLESRCCLAATGLAPSTVNLNQADIAMLADVARGTYGVDGTGIRVGIISDSFNALGGYAYDVARGVLPDDVTVVHEGVPRFEGSTFALTDEGRGMAQLVHAVAPGAELFFSAYSSVVIDAPKDLADGSLWGKFEQDQLIFADRIRELAIDYGCQIIVDDIGLFEPVFQDGPISQAISEVTELGVTYFTAASNNSNNGYQSAYQPLAFDTVDAAVPEATRQLLAGKTLHNFGTADAPVAFQRITLAGTPAASFDLHWAQPWGANASDITLAFFDAELNWIFNGIENPTGTWPHATLLYFSDLGAAQHDFHVAIVHEAGVSPNYLKWILDTNGAASISVTPATGFQTGTSNGHTNSAHGASVGAVNYWSTPAYRETARLTNFSSWGGIPVFFDAAGEPLAAPEYRPQPRFVAPQNGDTSFFGNSDIDSTLLKNFSGTSAAAPNAAAVAALMKQLRPDLTPDTIIATLAATATPFAVPGYEPEGTTNVAIGAGLINARDALAAVADISISGVVFEDLDRDGLRGTDEVGVAGSQVFLDGNSNGQRDVMPAAGSGQAFVGWTSDTPLVLPPVTSVLNPNAAPGTPATIADRGLLTWPAREQSAVTVVDMAGVVTDVSVTFELTRGADAQLNEPVGSIFVTLVSPQGIRVPVAGTRMPGAKEAYADSAATGKVQTSIPAGASRLSVLAGQEPRPAEEFPLPAEQAAEFSGSSSSVSLGDLSAFFGTPANGTWQLEVTNADSNHSLTLSNWSLFVATAEPQTTTDSQGRYAFEKLAPSAIGGAYVPTLTAPSPYHFELAVGQAVSDANFGVPNTTPVSRPPLRRSATLRIQAGTVGPQPVQFSWADLAGAVLSQPTTERFVVVQATSGVIEKWDGQQWIDVTRLPTGSSPQELLRLLSLRVIRPTDQIRWVPPAPSAPRQTAFQILGWDGGSVSDGLADISFDSAVT